MTKSPKSKPNKRKAGKQKQSFTSDERVKVISGAFIISVAVYMLFGVLSYFFTWQIDQSKLDISFIELFKDSTITVENWAGKLGATFGHVLVHNWFGIASLSIVFILGLLGLRMLNLKVLPFKKSLKYTIVITIWLSIALGFLFSDSLFLPGGAHGHFMSIWLSSFIGKIGTAFILIVTLFGILVFLFDGLLDKIKAFGLKLFDTNVSDVEMPLEKEVADIEQHEPTVYEQNITADSDTENIDDTEPKMEQEGISFEVRNTVEEEQAELEIGEEKKEEVDDLDQFDNIETIEVKVVEKENKDQEVSNLPNGSLVELNESETEGKSEDLELSVEMAENDDVLKKVDSEPVGDYDPTLDLSNYKLPAIDLLAEHDSKNVTVSSEELNSNKDRIVETLGNYKIEIVDIKAIVGPTITLYEIVPAPGVRISKIKNLEDDIALSLAALGIRIIAPIPGKGTIGIEVPNLKPKVVSMRSIIASKTFQESGFELPLALGKTISNDTFVVDLAKMPHMLVAGATGQGKSVGLNAILTSLLYKKHPAQLKMVLVDPKKVELTLYQKIEKHFLAILPGEEEAIITDTQKVVNTLNSLCVEMDSRYDLLKAAHVRNIKEYNTKFISRKLNPQNGHKFLPYIVVVIDEFADLIMTAGKEVELPIARLAQLARAIGIHLIIATQRPTTNIITGLIKANFPARIAFRVTSMMDSRTILDSPGANQLIGRGDMLISQGSDMVRLQCAFVDTPEIEEITTFIEKQQSYPSAYQLPEYVDENTSEVTDVDLSKRDAMFEDAARLIVANQQGSTSLIQRKFSIGYNRAGRIIDQLEAAGIVGPFEGSKARQVLIPDEYSLEQLFTSLNNN